MMTESCQQDGMLMEKCQDEQLEGPEPTAEELTTLQRVADKIPLPAYLIVIIELCERFNYYSLSNPFQNYIQHKPTDEIPGAIGLQQAGATALNSFFSLWVYFTPIIGAIVSDQYLGKYWTIFLFLCVLMVGQIVLILTSIPPAIENKASLPGLIVAMIFIGLGAGAVKVTVSPFVAEQYKAKKQFIKVLSNKRRVIVDYGVTIQRIFLLFYLAINVGSFGGTVSIFLEKYFGFWVAFLVPFFLFPIAMTILVVAKKKYTCQPPQGSVILNAIRVLWISAKGGFNLEKAKPSKAERNVKVYWDDAFVDELRIALVACKLFLYFPIYWLSYNQMITNLLSQAATMQLHGLPSELTQQINPVTLVLLIPVFNSFLYPKLRKVGILLRPVTRVTIGFFFASLAMVYSALIQHKIYTSPPCYKYPGNMKYCSAITKQGQPNQVHVAYQLPSYMLIAISEIFASTTGLEYAYTKAPASMKSFVMSMYMLTIAGGSLIQMTLSPLSKDPYLVGLYSGVSVVIFLAGVLFWFIFKKYNQVEDEMNLFQRQQGS